MTRLELMQLSQGLSDLYTGLETDLLANLAAFLTAEQADMPSAQWKIQMLAQLGALDRKNLRTITQYVKNVPRMLQDALQAGVLSALEDLEPGFRQMVLDGILQGTDTPVEDTMARALKTYARQARKSMNMVNTVMRYKARDAAHKAINDTAELADKQEFLNVLNKAAGKTVSGIESRQAAMRQCIKEMTDKGIPAFVDKRGREWSPEAYVNMAIRTTAANTAQQAQFDRMDDYGLNLVEVSSHSGARPKCAKDQGKIFNRSGGGGYTTDLHGRKIRYYAWSESSYGEPDGILGINCGHQIYPFTPGVSYQTYFPEPEEENAEAYKKSQQQRELERRVRKSKRECMMLETAGDPEGARQAQQLLKQRQDALRQFCGDNGLRYKPDRTAVADYKKSVAGYVPPDQTERIRKLNGLDVDKSGGSGIIIKEQSKEPITEITDKAIESVPKIKIDGYTDKQCELIQQHHKELLKYSRDNNDSKEVAFVMDSSMSSRKEFVGSDDKLDFGSELYGKDLFVMHNHPRNSSYSITDLIFFRNNTNVKTLTIIKNSGGVEFITKTSEFDGNKYKLEYDRLYKKIVLTGTESEKDKFVRTFLRKTKSGVIWNERQK
mgnify:CR=1 FL=1